MIKNIINKIKKNNHDIINNKKICIEFPLKKLKETIPGIQKGDFTIITASSGVGKTQFTKWLYFSCIYNIIRKKENEDIKILYFALEESEEEFLLSIISFLLYKIYGIQLSVMDLMQVRNNIIEKDVLQRIEKIEPIINLFLSKIEIYTHISSPTKILKKIKDFSNKNGTHYYYNYIDDPFKKKPIKEQDLLKLESGTEKYTYLKYRPSNENQFVVVIIDHISLLTPEKSETLHQTMSKMSAEYGRKIITKQYKYALVFVQQQSAEKEKDFYTYSGEKVEEKLIPSLDGLADNKMTQRDALNVIGLFSPIRYNIKFFSGYDIRYLKDNYRSLEVLKSRYGRSNLRINMYFNGKVNMFSELPPPSYFTEEKYREIELNRQK